ncbi:MAG TPA: hypothetical protein VN934_10640 [Candidatus Tumulicola sp.]|jgi:hypothetical protein|nr:hypothetical protein [Candidatus Tumulicola sp.]
MDAPQAAEHLDAVDDILRRAEVAGSPPALQFIVWGAVGIAFNTVGQLVGMGKVGPSAFWLAGAVLALALVVSAWDGRRMQRTASRQSTIGRLAAFSFWVAAGVMTVLTVMNEFTNLFPPFSPGVFYAAGMSIALLALGFGLRSTVLTLGGLALVASIAVAFLVPVWLGAILAIGNFAGFILPGISFAMAKSDG